MLKMLKINNLSIDLGDFKLKNINLEVADKEYMVILGPTGAGKTILLETIAGVYKPEKGRIFLEGREITGMRPRNRNVGMVYQDYMLFPHLNVEKNIKFGLKIQGYLKEVIEEKTKEALELFEISHLKHRYPGTLSGGEQQKTSIARAMVCDPDILLFDEPLGSLDPPTREELSRYLSLVHQKTGIKTLHVTHNYEEAMYLGDRIAILNKGEIIQIGEPMEVFGKPKSEFVANFVATRNVFKGDAIQKGNMFEVELDGATIQSVSGREGNVRVCIRPEEILVSTKPINTSGRNTIHGKVKLISHLGVIVNITVENHELEFIATITEASLAELGINVGSEVYLTFKATSVHLI